MNTRPSTRHVTVPLGYGCRVEMQANGPYWSAGFSFVVGHVYYSFEVGDRMDLVQWRVRRQIRDRDEKGIGATHGCEYPLGGI